MEEAFLARTKRFAAGVIRLYVRLPKGCEEAMVCGRQVLRSGTSVAAHVREANRARSDAEFVAKLGVALQEADESQLWFELLHEECGVDGTHTDPLHVEAGELIAIFTTIVKRSGGKGDEVKLK